MMLDSSLKQKRNEDVYLSWSTEGSTLRQILDRHESEILKESKKRPFDPPRCCSAYYKNSYT